MRTGKTSLRSKQTRINPIFSQAMKVIRADLTAEGRLDILERVMTYRGGPSNILFVHVLALMWKVFRVHASGKPSSTTQGQKFDKFQDRRRIEREAFSGQLLGIIATNALELGVDIGVLDVVVVLGFPLGGLASFVRPLPHFACVLA